MEAIEYFYTDEIVLISDRRTDGVEEAAALLPSLRVSAGLRRGAQWATGHRIEFFLGVTQKTEPCKTLVGEFPAMTQCLEVVGWRISSRKPFTATS